MARLRTKKEPNYLRLKILNEVLKNSNNTNDETLNTVNLNECSVERYREEPEPIEFLVNELIPVRVAGAIYSQGGLGKSTIALDLSIRSAIAKKYPSKWFGEFSIQYQGKVFYMSGEEPEREISSRYHQILNVIALELSVSKEDLMKEAEKNFYLLNTSANAQRLFESNRKGTDITPSEFYENLNNKILGNDIGDLGLLVFDTRSRYSCAEGMGNSVVSREVSFYEKMAQKYNCTVLIIHHSNKKSYDGNSHSAESVRGETAFLDSLRLGFEIKKGDIDIDSLDEHIDEECINDYLIITNSKQNYAKMYPPFLILREGFQFQFIKKGVLTKAALRKQKTLEEDLDKVIDVLNEGDGINHSRISKEANLTNNRVGKAVELGVKNGLLRIEHVETNNAKNVFFVN